MSDIPTAKVAPLRKIESGYANFWRGKVTGYTVRLECGHSDIARPTKKGRRPGKMRCMGCALVDLAGCTSQPSSDKQKQEKP